MALGKRCNGKQGVLKIFSRSMNTKELVDEIEKRFAEDALPSLWIKLFKDLNQNAQHELLQYVELLAGEVPIFGGVWREANNRFGRIAKERVWLLVTSRFVYWGCGRKHGKMPPARVMELDDVTPTNRHFLSRGYFGLRRFVMVLDDQSRMELPCKGGGAVGSVWSALPLLCVRHREAVNASGGVV
jgi:hypothetical protein